MPRRKNGRRAEALWRRTTTLWSGRRTCHRWHSRCTNLREAKAPWKTTQDLFTQAEYFAEEANRLYKVVRQFSYQVRGDRLAYRRRSKRDDTSFFNWTDVDILIYISPLLLWSFFYHCLLYGLYIGLDSAFLDPRYIGNLFTYAIEFRFFVSRNVEAASSLQRESIPFLIHAIMKYSLVDANNYCYFNNIQSKNFHRT